MSALVLETGRDAHWEANRRLADRFFRGALAVTAAITAVWLVLLLSGRGSAVLGRPLDPLAPVRVLFGFVIVGVLWGWLWYGVKRLLLRRLVGLSREETDGTFLSRMTAPFDLQALLRNHSERRVRIADMIGRRGRYVTIGMAGYAYVYSRIALEPKPDFLVMGLQESLFDALVFSWADAGHLLLGRVPRTRGLRLADPPHGRHARTRQLRRHHDPVEPVQVHHGAARVRARLRLPPPHLRDALRDRLGLLPRLGRAVRDRGLALGEAEAARLGHRRGEPQVARGDLGLLPGLARDLPVARPRERAGPGLGRAGRRRLRVEHRRSSSSPRGGRTTSRWRPATRSCAGPSAA